MFRASSANSSKRRRSVAKRCSSSARYPRSKRANASGLESSSNARTKGDVGLSTTYKHSFGAADLSVKFSVYNLFDRQVVTEVNEDRELANAIGLTNPLYGQGTGYQSARYGQITVSLAF